MLCENVGMRVFLLVWTFYVLFESLFLFFACIFAQILYFAVLYQSIHTRTLIKPGLPPHAV